MKTLIATFTILTAVTALANECETFFPESKELYECTSIDNPTTLVTKEGRLIFISLLACLDKKEKSVDFVLNHPFNNNDSIELTSDNDDGFKARKSESVYPSGNMMKRYTIVQTLELKKKSDDQIEFNYRKVEKHLFRSDELRATGNYTCTKIR